MSVVFVKRLIRALSIAGFLAIILYFVVVGFDTKKPNIIKESVANPSHPAPVVTRKPYHFLGSAITAQPIVQAFMAQDPEGVQLINFFSYGCYGCMLWHPLIEKWIQNNSTRVKAYDIPILFHQQWEPLARAYYVAKTLKRPDLDGLIFQAIHETHMPLTNQQQLADFFSTHRILPKIFNDLYHSFSINQSLMQAKNIAFAYQITTSPSLILNTPHGSYLITPEMIPDHGTEKTLFEVLDGLLRHAQEKANA
jgi:thiol:disulfide interchange protein DsbA